jgi:hypothetical protein
MGKDWHVPHHAVLPDAWIPAFAGMTKGKLSLSAPC